MDARLAITAALALAPLALSCGDEPMAEEAEAGDGDGDSNEDLGCPPGAEGCPCLDGLCEPGFICLEVTPGEGGTCEPDEDPCPVGSLGCECTMGGDCDGELVCEAGICSEDPGAEGMPCEPGSSCSLGLICLDGSCHAPGPGDPLGDGWGEVRCSGSNCKVARGDVWLSATRACEVAAAELSGAAQRVGTWPANWGCGEGEPITTSLFWDEVGCFGDAWGCIARKGTVWVRVVPECSVPPHTGGPWTVGSCDPDTPMTDAEEWRCDESLGCYARYGDLWTSPLPGCDVDGTPWDPASC